MVLRIDDEGVTERLAGTGRGATLDPSHSAAAPACAAHVQGCTCRSCPRRWARPAADPISSRAIPDGVWYSYLFVFFEVSVVSLHSGGSRQFLS
jgi:hypothetical protein